jgi:hypothetical protein
VDTVVNPQGFPSDVGRLAGLSTERQYPQYILPPSSVLSLLQLFSWLSQLFFFKPPPWVVFQKIALYNFIETDFA